MKREIKFRVWDAEEKCLFHEGMKYLTTFFDDAGELFTGVYVDESSPLIRFELSQFTGLKDKNGKEIYEGDIVISETYDDWGPREVEMEYQNWEPFQYWMDSETWEVIGNIYENPELLSK